LARRRQRSFVAHEGNGPAQGRIGVLKVEQHPIIDECSDMGAINGERRNL